MNAVRRALWMLGAPVRALLVGVVRVYQVTFSGAFGGRCKYYPSCSRYAVEAIRAHGAFKGSALTTWRLLRCNPLSLGGVDHVPRTRSNTAGAYDPILQEGRPEGDASAPASPDRVEA